MSKSDGWEWKPKAIDIPVIKKLKPKTGKKAKRKLVTKLDNANFYLSDEWRAIRVRVLEKYECKCMMCGRSPRMHNIVIHVDHIKPRSKHPELSLEITNLQLLCEDCNKGKSNRYDTDWRPDLDEINIVLDAMRLI
ncbi:MAG: HNH endonuclease [Cellvibrio sp.]|nr:HNH endonuclease [Cellvibrio sp.]